MEQHDEWEAEDRSYLSEASMAALQSMNITTAEEIEEEILVPEITAA